MVVLGFFSLYLLVVLVKFVKIKISIIKDFIIFWVFLYIGILRDYKIFVKYVGRIMFVFFLMGI